jgi:hypothetical protein
MHAMVLCELPARVVLWRKKGWRGWISRRPSIGMEAAESTSGLRLQSPLAVGEAATPPLYPRDPALEGSDLCSSHWIWHMVEASPSRW